LQKKGKIMATLRIYNDITTEDEKLWYSWFGMEGVCFKDIDTFAQSIPKDDDEIDMRIFCSGGNVQEGWAIYDRLRQTSKKISCTIEGKAASMATIIMLAAPKENRHAYENASILVHNPWVAPYALGEACNADDLQKYANELRQEQNKMLDLYVSRCGCDREEMQQLMDKDTWITTDKAIELGLIADTLPPISASAKNGLPINIKKSNMSEKKSKVEVEQSFVDKVLHFFGKKNIAEICFGMELSTVDGQTLTVERDEGEPQVGDKAAPDGTFEMPDGKTITVKDGVITDIQTAEDGEGGNEGGNEKEGDGNAGNDTVAQLTQQVNNLTKERDELKAQLADAQKNAKSKDDLRILNAVKMAGGAEKVLAKFASSYTPTPRQPEGKRAEEHAGATTKDALVARFKARHGKK